MIFCIDLDVRKNFQLFLKMTKKIFRKNLEILEIQKKIRFLKNFRLFQKQIFDMIVLGVPDAQTDHQIHQRDAWDNFSLNIKKSLCLLKFLSRFSQNFHENYLSILYTLYLPWTAKNATTIRGISVKKAPPFKIFREFKGGGFLIRGGFLNTHMTQIFFAPSARLSINQWFYTVLYVFTVSWDICTAGGGKFLHF